jgi:tetrahydromethanopterin S-methyltransferase subunit C
LRDRAAGLLQDAVLVSNQEEVSIGYHHHNPSIDVKIPRVKRRLAAFALAGALSILFWMAIICGVYWVMRG